jgi:DNA-binding transcriptional LysR family regulator
MHGTFDSNGTLMLDLNDVYYFVQVVENKGITAAARALDLPKSSLSRRILALEAALDARLIQRTSRRFVVTEVGEAFYKHALAMLVEAEAAENVVRQRTAEPSGTIRLSCSVAFAQLALADLIPQFMAAYPRVRIIQHATNRQVDPVQDGFDLCLRAHSTPLPDSTLVQRPLALTPWHLFAGPAYLKRNGMPDTPAALSAHDGIALGGMHDTHAWQLRDVRHAVFAKRRHGDAESGSVSECRYRGATRIRGTAGGQKGTTCASTASMDGRRRDHQPADAIAARSASVRSGVH